MKIKVERIKHTEIK